MERHGFVTFWLVLGVIVCSLAGYGYLFYPNIAMQSLYGYRASSGLLSLIGILLAICAVCYILLLCWKKIGFWLFVVDIIIQSILFVIIGAGFGQALFSIVTVAILWGVLHIRKNGISTWDYLSGNYTYEETSTNKKCRQCNTVYTSSRSTCPNCGSSLYEETNQKQVSEYKPISTPISGDTWVCKNCNEVNRSTSSSCKGCGEYR